MFQPKVNLLDKKDKLRCQSITSPIIYHGQVSHYDILFAVNQLERALSKLFSSSIDKSQEHIFYLECSSFSLTGTTIQMITSQRRRIQLPSSMVLITTSTPHVLIYSRPNGGVKERDIATCHLITQNQHVGLGKHCALIKFINDSEY